VETVKRSDRLPSKPPSTDYRLRRRELLSCIPLIALQKLRVSFSPGGFEKIPHILGIFLLDILLPLLYFRLILKQVLIIEFEKLVRSIQQSLAPGAGVYHTYPKGNRPSCFILDLREKSHEGSIKIQRKQ
jgi:hypothetical protein